MAEELVQELLRLAQGHAQLAHHGTHGLAVAHTAVELLHPGLERLLRTASQHGIEPLRKLRRARAKALVARLEVGEGCLQEQHRRGGFHGQFRARRLAGLGRQRGHAAQHIGERLALRMKLEQRFGHQPELVHRALLAREVTTSQSRPVFLDRFDAAPRLRQHGRVEQAKGRFVVIDRLVSTQVPGRPDRPQHRRAHACAGAGLGTEEQQFERQSLGHVLLTLGQGCVLEQDA